MKTIKLFALAVALAFAATMAITPNASAASAGSRSNVVALQGQQPATPQQTTPQQAEPGSQAQQAQSFTGTIKNANGEYVLYVPASRTAYKLDDQSKAKQFEGQTVTVQGVLDSSTNTIKVSDIQPASAQ